MSIRVMLMTMIAGVGCATAVGAGAQSVPDLRAYPNIEMKADFIEAPDWSGGYLTAGGIAVAYSTPTEFLSQLVNVEGYRLVEPGSPEALNVALSWAPDDSYEPSELLLIGRPEVQVGNVKFATDAHALSLIRVLTTDYANNAKGEQKHELLMVPFPAHAGMSATVAGNTTRTIGSSSIAFELPSDVHVSTHISCRYRMAGKRVVEALGMNWERPDGAEVVVVGVGRNAGAAVQVGYATKTISSAEHGAFQDQWSRQRHDLVARIREELRLAGEVGLTGCVDALSAEAWADRMRLLDSSDRFATFGQIASDPICGAPASGKASAGLTLEAVYDRVGSRILTVYVVLAP